jgi:phage tail-like protein
MLGDATKIGMANRFTVKIEGGEDLGSWSQVDGLDVKWDLAEYRAGDNGNDRWYFPANTHYSVVKLARAASDESKRVRDWLNKTSFDWKPGSIATVKLYDAGLVGIDLEWELRDVMPLHWAISGFEAGASRVAVETLQLAHMGFLGDLRKIG